ncbi:MAG: hypothetical protein JXA23_06705 [Bacteroidales bacterium]|nr:hypothetical protein [Bacteroidales bacterium]
MNPSTTYYFRAFAINHVGAGYGEEKSFTTLEEPVILPTVQTHPPVQITNTSAVCSGTVQDEGTSPVVFRGICWSTSPDPSLSDTCTVEGSGPGSFSSQLTGLS